MHDKFMVVGFLKNNLEAELKNQTDLEKRQEKELIEMSNSRRKSRLNKLKSKEPF